MEVGTGVGFDANVAFGCRVADATEVGVFGACACVVRVGTTMATSPIEVGVGNTCPAKYAAPIHSPNAISMALAITTPMTLSG